MSRRQKRLIRREKRRHECHTIGYDRHHIFYQRVNWARGVLAVLRQYPYCKIYIPRKLHDRIHEEIGNITPPSLVNAIDAMRQLRNLELYGSISELDDFEQRLKVLIFLFDSVEPKTVECLKKQLEIVRDFYGEPS